MGKRAVFEVLAHQKERVVAVYVAKGCDNELIEKLKEHNIAVKLSSKIKLFYKTRSENHGSIVAELLEKKPLSLPDFLEKKRKSANLTILALDQLSDPQNVGAILRAAECFAIDLVLLPKKRSCKLTPVVTKASSGASELIPICFHRLQDALCLCQKHHISAFALQKVDHAISIYQMRFPTKRLFIVGSEGQGIRPLLATKCACSLYIPLKGKIKSLNVSQATAILLSSICNAAV